MNKTDKDKSADMKTDKEITELEQTKAELVQANEAKLRLLADFQNYKKRVEAERSDAKYFAAKDIIGRIIDIVDDIQRAKQHNSESKKAENADVEMVLAKLLLILSDYGVMRTVISVGDKFEADKMEAIATVPADKDKHADTVVHADSCLYLDKENKVIKTAKVIIAKK